MKKYILIFVLILSGITSANSQVLITLLLGDKLNSDGIEFGLEGGLNWSLINNLDANKFNRTFNLGFYFHLRMKNQWWVYTGVLVKSNNGVYDLSEKDLKLFGIDIYNPEGTYFQRINTFMVPFFIKYNFKNHIFIEGGPQFGLMYNSETIYKETRDNNDIFVRTYNKDKINKIDAGAGIGLGYTFLKGKGWTIEGRAYRGFINVLKGVKGTGNTVLYIEAKIPIGVGKKDDLTNNKN